MSDKLTEIMAWKRREIAARLRPVSEAELAKVDATLPRPPAFGSGDLISARLHRGGGARADVARRG